jgi:hypothetical protein
MKKIIAYLLLIFLFSCKQDNKQIVIPDTVLSKEKMAEIVLQIHLAEANANLNSPPDVRLTSKVNLEEIIKSNNLSEAQYDSSMTFYINHPLLLNEVYEITLNELSKKQSKGSQK